MQCEIVISSLSSQYQYQLRLTDIILTVYCERYFRIPLLYMEYHRSFGTRRRLQRGVCSNSVDLTSNNDIDDDQIDGEHVSL